jgi:putative flippase GtrA
MASQSLGITLWIVLMLLAVPYVRHARHPRAKPLAAYMVFVILFSVGAMVMYSVLLMLLGWLDGFAYLHRPVGAAVFLALVFIPAFLLGRWQMKKPPRQMPSD